MQTTTQPNPILKKLQFFSFPNANSPMEKKIVANVRTHGIHIVAVQEYKNTPQFFYTIGLKYQHRHPELLIMGVDVNVAYEILMRAYALIKNGGSIGPWTTQDSISYTTLKTVPIQSSNYSKFLGFAMWFYRSMGRSKPDAFPAIQLVWPDVMKEAFPWDGGYDVGFISEQHLLCNEQALKKAVERNAWDVNETCVQAQKIE